MKTPTESLKGPLQGSSLRYLVYDMSFSEFQLPTHKTPGHRLLLSDDPKDVLDGALQQHIIDHLWNSTQHHDSAAYFNYFRLECDAWRLSDTTVAIYTYQDLLDLIRHISDTRGEKRSSNSLLEFFPPLQPSHEKTQPLPEDLTLEQLELPVRHRFEYCDPVAANNSIYLAVRLWLMLNVGSSHIYTYSPGKSSPEWTEDQSLDDFVDSCFPNSEYGGPRLSQWPYSLNAWNLERIGGFQILWTDNLADHLYLNDDLGTIHIYHHVQVLRGLLYSKEPDYALPDRLIVETLQTLALLIPRANRDCKEWFTRIHRTMINEESNQSIDKGAGDVELLHWARSPEKYKYWGQRLEMIKQAYDESEPKSLGQWWHDRRSKVQWYTFWVAILVLILTIVFGLIQSVTGIMQVYYAAHSGASP